MILIKYITAIVLIYFYIYSPALQGMSFGIDKLVLVGALIYLLFSKNARPYLKLFAKDFRYLIAITIFSVCVFVVHLGEGDLLMYDLFLLIEPIPVACVLYELIQIRYKITIREIILLTSGIAGLITVYLLFNQDLANYVKTSVLRVPEVVTTYFSFRGFGFSDGLLNSYPTAQGLILGLMLVGFFRTKQIFFLLAIPIFVSVIVNARTGVVPILIGAFLFFIYVPGGKKWNILLWAGIVVSLFFLVLNNVSLFSEAEESISWGKTFLDIISAILKGEEGNPNVDDLTRTMLFLPSNLTDWLIGTGKNVFANSYYRKLSDIGYVIRLLYGGVFYLILTLSYVLYICKRVYWFDKATGCLLLLSFLAFNYKTDFLTVASCSRLFFLLYVIMVCENAKKEQLSII